MAYELVISNFSFKKSSSGSFPGWVCLNSSLRMEFKTRLTASLNLQIRISHLCYLSSASRCFALLGFYFPFWFLQHNSSANMLDGYVICSIAFGMRVSSAFCAFQHTMFICLNPAYAEYGAVSFISFIFLNCFFESFNFNGRWHRSLSLLVLLYIRLCTLFIFLSFCFWIFFSSLHLHLCHVLMTMNFYSHRCGLAFSYNILLKIK